MRYIPPGLRVLQILQVFVLPAEVRLLLHHLVEEVDGPGDDALVLPRLDHGCGDALVVGGVLIALHRVGLAAARLSIRKDRGIVALKSADNLDSTEIS